MIRFWQRFLWRSGAALFAGIAGWLLVTRLWPVATHPQALKPLLLIWMFLAVLGLGSWWTRTHLRVAGYSLVLGWAIAAGAGSAWGSGFTTVAWTMIVSLLIDVGWACAGELLMDFQEGRQPAAVRAPGPRADRRIPKIGTPAPANDRAQPVAEDRRIASPAVDKAMHPEVPHETLEGLVGMRKEVDRFCEVLTECLNDPLASNGILLFGPPGNGKTMLVRAACGSMQKPLIHVSHADLASPWVGQGARGLADMFDAAMRSPQAILFIDEIDAVIPDRTRSAAQDVEAGKTANAFLAKVNEARSAGLIVIGATNFLERLDAAAVREGRFDHKVEIPNPDLASRQALLARFAPTMSVEQNERAALRLGGHSAARIRAVAEKASKDAGAVTLGKTGKTGAPATPSLLDWPALEKALRSIQSSMGQSLEGVPKLSELVIEDPAGSRLLQIAHGLKSTDALLTMGGQPPTGALFLGPPGTGKTLAARALAKELSMAFFSTNGFDLASDDGAIDAFFQRGKDARPAVLFIDEAEDLLVDRSRGGRGFMTGKMLSMLDGASGKSPDVFVVCATNHADRIDPAFLRPGRLSEAITFAIPGLMNLTRLVAQRLTALPKGVGDLVSASDVAQALLGLTPAAVTEAFNQAVALAVAGQRTSLILDDLVQARRKLGL